jgi:hypothetical protein
LVTNYHVHLGFVSDSQNNILHRPALGNQIELPSVIGGHPINGLTDLVKFNLPVKVLLGLYLHENHQVGESIAYTRSHTNSW